MCVGPLYRISQCLFSLFAGHPMLSFIFHLTRPLILRHILFTLDYCYINGNIWLSAIIVPIMHR